MAKNLPDWHSNSSPSYKLGSSSRVDNDSSDLYETYEGKTGHTAVTSKFLYGGQFDATAGAAGYKTQYRAQVAAEGLGNRMSAAEEMGIPADSEAYEKRVTKNLGPKRKAYVNAMDQY